MNTMDFFNYIYVLLIISKMINKIYFTIYNKKVFCIEIKYFIMIKIYNDPSIIKMDHYYFC